MGVVDRLGFLCSIHQGDSIWMLISMAVSSTWVYGAFLIPSENRLKQLD